MKPLVGGRVGTPRPPQPCRGWIEGAMGAIRARDPIKKLCPPALDPKAIRGESFCRDPLPATVPMWADPWVSPACNLGALGRPCVSEGGSGVDTQPSSLGSQMRLSLAQCLRRSPWRGRRT